MARLDEVAERDRWTCWLCDGAVDPDAPINSPGAGTVDHVVPKSRGGRTEPQNLRLAHRRCNTNRGNDLPERDWPDRLMVIDPTSLWVSLARILRRREPEIVAVSPTTELAIETGEWAKTRVQRFVGGSWAVSYETAGMDGERTLVRLELTGEPEIDDVGRPVSGRKKRRR